MDWVEGKLTAIKNRISNISLKRTLAVYILIAVISVLLCYSFTMQICNGWEKLILEKYKISVNAAYSNEYYLTRQLKIWPDIINIIRSFCLLIYSAIAVIITSNFFYDNKLKEPLYLLKKEAEAVGRKDLSFECTYDSRDEMGEMCGTLNKMRLRLIDDQKVIWGLMEEQRQINAAFAHDLRTPLTVMKGYIELINNYYPKRMITEEKMFETLNTLMVQVERLEKFSGTMKNIHSFEEMEAKRKKHKFSDCYDRIKEAAYGLSLVNNIVIEVECQQGIQEQVLYFDEMFIMEVYDNLISNAVRFTKNRVEVLFTKDDRWLFLYVKDNGRGFPRNELSQADKAYYTRDKEDTEHFGLGLTISRRLCEKHGGYIWFSNSINGGAIVCASFEVD